MTVPSLNVTRSALSAKQRVPWLCNFGHAHVPVKLSGAGTLIRWCVCLCDHNNSSNNNKNTQPVCTSECPSQMSTQIHCSRTNAPSFSWHAQANKQKWQSKSINNQRGDCQLWTTALHLFFTRLHPSTFPYSILVFHSGDEVVSIATTQGLGVGALATKLAEKDGLH